VYTFVTLKRVLGVKLSDLTLVLLAAGEATRFERGVRKQWLLFSKIVVASHPDDIGYMRRFGDYSFTKGGGSRQESLSNALEEVDTELVLVSDVARACVSRDICLKLIEAIGEADSAVPALRVSDTV